MNRLFSALVLGVYLASCAPALLPPAGSAAFGADPAGGTAEPRPRDRWRQKASCPT